MSNGGRELRKSRLLLRLVTRGSVVEKLRASRALMLLPAVPPKATLGALRCRKERFCAVEGVNVLPGCERNSERSCGCERLIFCDCVANRGADDGARITLADCMDGALRWTGAET